MESFFDERNAQMLFSVAYKYILKQIDYQIGDNGEYELLSEVMNYVKQTQPDNTPLLDLNKKVLDVFNDFVIAKNTVKPLENANVPTFITSTDDAQIETENIDPVEAEQLLITEPDVLADYNKNNNGEYYTDHILIDSRDRDTTLFPSPSNYRIDLLRSYPNVISLELVTAEIPISEYNVNSTNNVIQFKEVAGSTVIVATIPPGNYSTLASFKSIVETTMNNASAHGASYTLNITTLASQNKVILSSDIGGTSTLFSVLFSSSSSRRLFGMNAVDKTGTSSYTSDTIVSLDKEQYLTLAIENIRNITSTHSITHNAFAKIPLNNDDSTGRKYFSTSSDYNAVKVFQPQMPKLDHLHLSFNSYNGLYDFNGLDHSLTFKVVYINATT
jgi:hypothetical protein